MISLTAYRASNRAGLGGLRGPHRHSRCHQLEVR